MKNSGKNDHVPANSTESAAPAKAKTPARLWHTISEKKLSRNLAGFTISAIVHLTVLFIYIGISAFDQPEVIEIREISFVDMTAPAADLAPKKKKHFNRRKQETIAMARASKIEKNIPKVQAAVVRHFSREKVAVTQAVSLTRRLDMKRTQAPLQAAPISLVKKPLVEVLKISRAQGTRTDNKVRNPAAPIKLKRASVLKPPVKFPRSRKPVMQSNEKINLATRKNPPQKVQPDHGRAAFTSVFNAKSATVQIEKTKSGVTITGPLGSRKILKRFMPEFPDWAKRQGVGARVALQFTVMENGHVKENIIVMRTSGSAGWDKIVREALLKWRFAPLRSGGRRDQTGVITFQFVVN